MTDKQLQFITALLAQIGINYFDIKSYRDAVINKHSDWGKGIRCDGSTYTYRDVSPVINMLIDELQIKKNKQNIRRITPHSYITATDLAQYCYCPISYILTNSFKIEHPVNEDQMLMGEEWHKRLSLIKKQYTEDKNIVYWDSRYQNPEIQKILNSTSIFIGHDGGQNVVFFEYRGKLSWCP